MTVHLCNITQMYGERPVVLEDDYYPLELKECSISYIECVIERYVLLVGCPLLLFISLVGNSITVSVMMRPKLRRTATATFITTLAVMDTLANTAGLSRHFILKAFDVSIYHSVQFCWRVTSPKFQFQLSIDTKFQSH